MTRLLEDKVAIVTGSGRGVGRETALLFAENGAKVVITDIDEGPAKEVQNEIIKMVEKQLLSVGILCWRSFRKP
ncbi:SDR family NAD(P)-dependent oxidoreductase [Solibacillus sp. FSL K6-1523]|uniref:SDR family NAD(P)-dependent oxidoreductase n=1 Tax=Solibacillus sp. FSL K6-1523 TaxID=2921471 RepID=UPI0030F5A425